MDILYRNGGNDRSWKLPEETAKDIALQEIIGYMSSNHEEQEILSDVMSKIPQDPSDMIYRQEILKDLMSNEELMTAVRNSIDPIKVLQYYGGTKRLRDGDGTLVSLLEQLRELKVYVDVVESLYESLSRIDIRSEGLIALRDALKTIVEDDEFKSVKPDIEKMHDDLSNVRSAIVGVNFTPDLDIDNVTAIEFTDTPIRSNYTIADISITTKFSSPFKKTNYVDPLLVAMTPFMKKHLKHHFGDLKRLITKHSRYDTSLLTNLYNGFVFYLCAADLGRKLKSKELGIAFPEITADRPMDIKGLYNIRLSSIDKDAIVKNDFAFTEKEKMFILTGPNRGGKTILEQALGLISVMASLGMFVTADACSGMPFRKIFTHFPIDENLTINYGRLGEEAVRIKEIVSMTDSDTLILFNETFSTTSAKDGLYLSMDLLRILKEKGAAVIFNTHIHELADELTEMNGWEGKSDVVSIVMEIVNNKNTFKIKRSAPDTSSYARNIAEKYGITYEQMKELGS